MEDRYSKYFLIVIILLSFISIIVVLPYFHIYPNQTSIPIPSDIFETHQGIISFFGIIAAILIFLVTIWKQDNDRKKELDRRLNMARQLILDEIDEIKKIFSQRNLVITQHNIPFLNWYFNYDGYQNILYSGLLSHFNKKNQSLIKKLFHFINLHNEFLMQRYNFGNLFSLTTENQENINKWNVISLGINTYLNQLDQNIISLVNELENSLNKV